MNPRRSYSRHGLHVLKVAVRARGFGSIDGRTAAARALLSFRAELVVALGGEAELSPQQRKLVELAARASLYVDHVDAWLTEQRSLVNHRNRTLLPALVQRQALAEHLAKLLDRLGLERRAQKVPDLHDYLRGKYGQPRREHDGPATQRSATSADETSGNEPAVNDVCVNGGGAVVPDGDHQGSTAPPRTKEETGP